jgi:hypothetical protein
MTSRHETKNETKRATQKNESLLEGIFFSPSSFAKTKRWSCRKMRKGIVELESVNTQKIRR